MDKYRVEKSGAKRRGKDGRLSSRVRNTHLWAFCFAEGRSGETQPSHGKQTSKMVSRNLPRKKKKRKGSWMQHDKKSANKQKKEGKKIGGKR